MLFEPFPDSAAAEEDDEDAEEELELDPPATAAVVICSGVEVTTTVIGFVGSPALVADCVMTDVKMAVVGATDDADMTDVTTFVVLGSMVVVLSAPTTDDTDEATAEDIDDSTADDEAAADEMELDSEVEVTAVAILAMPN